MGFETRAGFWVRILVAFQRVIAVTDCILRLPIAKVDELDFA